MDSIETRGDAAVSGSLTTPSSLWRTLSGHITGNSDAVGPGAGEVITAGSSEVLQKTGCHYWYWVKYPG